MIAESSNPNYGEECLENWLKWRLYLSSSADQRLTVYPNTRVSLANLVRLLQETYKIRKKKKQGDTQSLSYRNVLLDITG